MPYLRPTTLTQDEQRLILRATAKRPRDHLISYRRYIRRDAKREVVLPGLQLPLSRMGYRVSPDLPYGPNQRGDAGSASKSAKQIGRW